MKDDERRHEACLQPACPSTMGVAGRRGPGGGKVMGDESQNIVHRGLLQASGHLFHVLGSSDAVHGGQRSLVNQDACDGSVAPGCDRPRYQ